MKRSKITILLAILTVLTCKNNKTEDISKSTVIIKPIEHGTLVLENENEVIYIDPTGGTEAFKGQKEPTLVLITDIHGDHLSKETLGTLKLDKATVIAPKAVMEKLPKDLAKIMVTLNNGDSYNFNKLEIEAIPMYNIREEALKYHTKGRGNGYIITINNERIYISGDTEDIPEMRNLSNIDKAFVCMNLPYTMPIESAASAVLELKPKTVYPYHYRGTKGMSDVNKFKTIVNKGDNSIKVELLDWY